MKWTRCFGRYLLNLIVSMTSVKSLMHSRISVSDLTDTWWKVWSISLIYAFRDSLLKHLTYMLFNVIIRSAFIVLCLKAASSIDLYFFVYILSVTFFILEFPFKRRKSLRHIFYTIHALLQLNYISCGFAWFWCWPILKHAL